ncbi:disks large-associated protein 1-like protein, partial [Lasius niger]
MMEEDQSSLNGCAGNADLEQKSFEEDFCEAHTTVSDASQVRIGGIVEAVCDKVVTLMSSSLHFLKASSALEVQ